MHLQHKAPAAPLDNDRIALVVHNPQQVELLCQGALGIQLGIGRPAALVVSRFTVLGLGCCGHHLAVPVEPGQAEVQCGLGCKARHSSTSSWPCSVSSCCRKLGPASRSAVAFDRVIGIRLTPSRICQFIGLQPWPWGWALSCTTRLWRCIAICSALSRRR